MHPSVEMMKQLEGNTTQQQDLREKHVEKESPAASRGYCLKLARHLMKKHHVGFDEAAFCKRHGITLKGR